MTDTPKLYDIFISYSRADIEVMRKVRDTLRANYIGVWTDETYLELDTKSWLKAIKKAIENSRGMVVICSPSSEKSEYVEIEIALAKENGLMFFPYWIEGKNATDSIPTLLTTHQWLDARSDKFGKIVELANAIKKRLNISDIKPQPAPVPKPQPIPQPIPTPKPTPVPQPTSAPVPQPTSAPVPQPIPAPESSPQTNSPIRKLETQSPSDWLLLLWWMLVEPHQIEAYKKQYGDTSLVPISRWLLGTLFWLPFVISLSAITLGFAPRANQEVGSFIPFVLLVIVLGLWLGMLLFMDMFEDFEDVAMTVAMILAFFVGVIGILGVVNMVVGMIIAIFLGGILIFNKNPAILDIDSDNGFTGVLSLGGVGIVSAMIGAVGVSSISVGSTILLICGSAIIASIPAFITGNFIKTSDKNAWISIFFIAFYTFMILGISISVGIQTASFWNGIVAGGASILVSGLILGAWTTIPSLIKETPWGGKFILGALSMLYLFLIWFYYLGGWHVVTPMAS